MDHHLLCVFSTALGTEEPLSSLDLARGETSSEEEEGEGGLRRRNVQSFETLRPRTSDDEDEDEEAEFRMAEKTEEKRRFSVPMHVVIVGALVLLCLGSLFLSGEFLQSADHACSCSNKR